MSQLQFAVPAGKSGMTMQRCVEAVIAEMKESLEAHVEGDRMYPEDVSECNNHVKVLWDEIKSLRDLASFSLSNAILLGTEYELRPEDPLMIVTRNAVLLEFIDHELGENSSSSIGNVMHYLFSNPVLQYPNSGSRVRH